MEVNGNHQNWRDAGGETGSIVGDTSYRVGVRALKEFTLDEAVFGERADFTLLGARTLEGLNVMVNSARKRLVAAGLLPAA